MQHNNSVVTILTPISQTRKLRLKHAKGLFESHVTTESQNGVSSPEPRYHFSTSSPEQTLEAKEVGPVHVPRPSGRPAP